MVNISIFPEPEFDELMFDFVTTVPVLLLLHMKVINIAPQFFVPNQMRAQAAAARSWALICMCRVLFEKYNERGIRVFLM